MSDRGPFALTRSQAEPEPHMDSSGWSGRSGRTDKSDQSDNNSSNSTNDYNVRHLFNILLIAFSSVPTTIFLAWILTWAIVILYLCTFGFAIGVASVAGLSMFIYGPVLCFCVISALGGSLVYNVARYSWEAAWRAWVTVRRVLSNLLAGPSSMGDKSITMQGDRTQNVPTGWPLFSWLFGDVSDKSDEENEASVGWGTLGAPPKEPDWGSQPLEERFETRPATAPGALPSGPGGGGGGMGMGRGRIQSPMPGTGTAGSLTSGDGGMVLGGGIAGHGGRKGQIRLGKVVVPPYHVR